MEGSKYLDLAEKMISAKGIPLTGAQIIDFASKYDKLPFEKYGTIVKTLQARIAEDISKHRKKSRFLRTGIGTYYLRRLSNEETIYGAIRWSPHRPPRRKPEHPHRILTLPRSEVSEGHKVHGWEATNQILEKGVYDYQSEIREDFIPVVTAVALMWNSNYFSYDVGVHTHFDKIVAKRSVLLRKYLDEFDLDLFETDGIGATSSAARAVLPVLTAGRRARLENGRLKKDEKLQFYQVARMLRYKVASISTTTDCFMLISTIDLSTTFTHLPETQRRLEINNADWANADILRHQISDRDSRELFDYKSTVGTPN